jgi:hypothetical protein
MIWLYSLHTFTKNQCFAISNSVIFNQKKGAGQVHIYTTLSLRSSKVHSLLLDHGTTYHLHSTQYEQKPKITPLVFPHMHARELINVFTPPFHVSDLPVGQQTYITCSAELHTHDSRTYCALNDKGGANLT